MAEKIRRPRGRPRKNADELVSLRPVWSFRIREKTREAIRDAAAKNGRSMSEEVEFRLECSLMKFPDL